jgi:hypothetical protein
MVSIILLAVVIMTVYGGVDAGQVRSDKVRARCNRLIRWRRNIIITKVLQLSQTVIEFGSQHYSR